MQVKVFYKNDEEEILDAIQIDDDETSVTVWLKEAMMRPPEKYPVDDAYIKKSDIKEMSIVWE